MPGKSADVGLTQLAQGVYAWLQLPGGLGQPPNIGAYKRFLPEFGAEFTDLETRPVTHVVDDPVMLTPAVEVIPVTGHTPANLVVVVPAAGVVFAGGMCAFGVTPLGFQADMTTWVDALDTLAGWAPVIVPGHGPVGGEGEVRQCQSYLRACLAANGDPAALESGPWDSWTDRRLDAINVERAARFARGDRGVPDAMLEAIGAEDNQPET